MTTRTLVRLYDNHTEAVAAVRALEEAGFGHEQVSILASDGAHRSTLGGAGDPSVNAERDAPPTVSEDTTAHGAGSGASIGTVVGGGLGLLAGLGTLFIPGLGPVVAAGWLVSTLSGAGIGAALGGAGGGLIGALTHAGVDEQDAHGFLEGIRKGGSLVSARVDDARLAEAERLLDHTLP